MTKTVVNMSISLDGFVAGPNQGLDNPLGDGGRQLHMWHGFNDSGSPLSPEDEVATADLLRTRGAVIMGRNMYGPVRGDWDTEMWTGWWGEDPPYHAPVFVLTNHAHESVEMDGGTTFHFVTGGFDAGMSRARDAAGPDGEILIAGGASTVRQAFQAGVVDEISLAISPVIMARGERIFDDIGEVQLDIASVVAAPTVTHVRYRVQR